MITPKQLASAISISTGVPEATIVVHDRNLANAPIPLRTVAGRGRAVAKMTSSDAANLLIAVMASENVKDSVKAVLEYGSLAAVGSNLAKTRIEQFDQLKPRHSFAEGLSSLMKAAALKQIRYGKGCSVHVRVFGPSPRAMITFNIVDQKVQVQYEMPGKKLGHRLDDLTRETQITEKTIIVLGAAMIGDLETVP